MIEVRMRLVCPNCAAQYEVDDSAIPDNGRDVQCANCGNTWFQGPAAAVNETGEQNGTEHFPAPTPRPTDPSVLDILRREAEHETTVRNSEIEAAEREQARDEGDADSDENTEEPAIEPSDERPEDVPKDELDGGLDDTFDQAETSSTTDDTANESDNPAATAAPLQDDGEQDDDAQDDGAQDDGAQDDGDELPNETFANRARAGRAKLRANRADIERAHRQRQQISTSDTETTSEFEEIAPTPQPSVSDSRDGEKVEGRRHSSLPEIKELQDSLRIARDKTNRAEPAELDVTNPKRRGGRAGFFIAVLLALILVAVYALKAQIIASLPQSEPYLNQYSALVDTARQALAVAIDAIVSLVRDLLAKYL